MSIRSKLVKAAPFIPAAVGIPIVAVTVGLPAAIAGTAGGLIGGIACIAVDEAVHRARERRNRR